MKRATLPNLIRLAIVASFALFAFSAWAQDTPAPAAPIVPANWQGWVLLAWPVIGSVASLLAQLLSKTSIGHQLFAGLAAIGLDVPTLLASIWRMISSASRATYGKRAAAAAAVAPVVLGIMVFFCGCSPAAQALEQRVEQTVATDLANGVALPQIEQDVAKVLAGQVGVDVVVVVQDAIAFLIDMGIIPASVQPYAHTVLGQAQAEHAAGHTLRVGQ
jgi:hypothetical protein